MNDKPTPASVYLYHTAMAVYAMTEDVTLIMPMMEKSADGGVAEARAWLGGYRSERLRKMFEACEPGELDDMKWMPWSCQYSNKFTGLCSVTASPCPKRGVNCQCDTWTEAVMREAHYVA